MTSSIRSLRFALLSVWLILLVDVLPVWWNARLLVLFVGWHTMLFVVNAFMGTFWTAAMVRRRRRRMSRDKVFETGRWVSVAVVFAVTAKYTDYCVFWGIASVAGLVVEAFIRVFRARGVHHRKQFDHLDRELTPYEFEVAVARRRSALPLVWAFVFLWAASWWDPVFRILSR